jgi:hypothetical protein
MTSPPAPYHDLLERLAGEGCPICGLVTRAVQRHLVAYATEGVNDLDVRARLRASRGYCHRHAHQFWEEVHHQLGVAMIYQDVIINLIRALQAADPTAATPLQRFMASLGAPRARAAADAAALAPQATCPACEAQADAERRAVSLLLRHLLDDQVAAAYGASTGLCLPHFSRVLAQARRDEQITLLVRTQLAAWQALHDALGEYIRLQDYRFRQEPRGAEQTAPRRAIGAIAGEKGAIRHA